MCDCKWEKEHCVRLSDNVPMCIVLAVSLYLSLDWAAGKLTAIPDRVAGFKGGREVKRGGNEKGRGRMAGCLREMWRPCTVMLAPACGLRVQSIETTTMTTSWWLHSLPPAMLLMLLLILMMMMRGGGKARMLAPDPDWRYWQMHICSACLRGRLFKALTTTPPCSTALPSCHTASRRCWV